MANLSNDLENWMTVLPQALKNVPIINLAIPGSHDSMSYGIRRRSKVAPDAEHIITKLYKVAPCIVRRWAITQKLNVQQQLEGGIRYLDLRICMNAKDNNFYFVHGLFCEEISKPFRLIRNFLDEHPEEFVIFDCQHFYNFANGDYGRLNRVLLKTFGSILYGPKDGPLKSLSLSIARSLGKQILVVYRYGIVPDKCWPSDVWPTPWPNQINVDKLQKYLDISLTYRSPDTGYVTQCVLTPPVKFILPRFYSSLRRACARRVIKELPAWIASQRPGTFDTNTDRATVNVFIADFVEINDSEFCHIVVNLNGKMLDDLIGATNEITSS